MKQFLESAFYLSALVFMWGKIGLALLTIILLILFSNYIKRIAERIFLLKEPI